ncbi:hypothetical protein ACI8AA_14660 [Geodermatophilus sp. SYSU D01180]
MLGSGVAVDLGPEGRAAAQAYLDALLPLLHSGGVDSFASLVVQIPEVGHTVQAFCAVGVLGRDRTVDGEAEVRVLAETGLHPGLERETTPVDLPVGRGLRSAAFRHATELIDSEGVAPYAAEVRYVVPLDAERVAVLHFETLSLVYLDELTEMFDAIAGTARVA